MVQRWSGIVEGYCKGSKAPNRVMASLCLSPSLDAFTIPTRNAIFFVGDHVQGAKNAVIERLSQLENIAAILLSKMEPNANVWVVEASRYVGSYACYDNFLTSMTCLGEPTKYLPHGLPATGACLSLLSSCIDEVKRHLTRQPCKRNVADTSEHERESTMLKAGESPPITLFGFSKGGVVLNQLLSEMAVENSDEKTAVKLHDSRLHEEQLGSSIGHYKNGTASAARLPITEKLTESSSSFPLLNAITPENYILPSSFKEFLGSVDQIHFVDVGLNREGAHIVDPCILDNIARVAMSRQVGISVIVHGTPRQWNKFSRPWILAEKDKFVTGLQAAAKFHGEEKLRVFERFYFPEKPPSLQMHFEIIEVLNIDQTNAVVR